MSRGLSGEIIINLWIKPYVLYVFYIFRVKQKPKELQTKRHLVVRKYVLCAIVGARQVKSGIKKYKREQTSMIIISQQEYRTDGDYSQSIR